MSDMIRVLHVLPVFAAAAAVIAPERDILHACFLTCRSSCDDFVTPAMGRMELSLVKPTPGMTPRFDSR